MLDKYRRKIKYLLNVLGKLGLSEQCKVVQANLMMLITNSDVMSERLTSQLVPSTTGIPYHLYPDDPEQVVILKKLVNILYNVKNIMLELETIDLPDDVTIDKFLIGHIPIIIKNAYKAINQVYEAVHLINNSGESIQAIIGPQFEGLKPGFNAVLNQLQKFIPSGAKDDSERKLGEMIGAGINLVPTQIKTAEEMSFNNVEKLIANIPNYFKQLQDIIESESLYSDNKEVSSAADYQYRLEKRAEKIVYNLDRMTTKTGLRLTYNYMQIIKSLGAYSIDLINTGVPATKEAYLKSIEKLNQFKHEILPNILSELDSLEESTGFKLRKLTELTLDSANIYYQKLVDNIFEVHDKVSEIHNVIEIHSNKWYGTVGRHLLFGGRKPIDTSGELEGDEHIRTLVDKGFIEKRRALQTQRLDEAKLRLYETEQSAESALLFFEKIESLNTYYNNGNFSKVSIEDRQELARLYRQCQSYIAAIDPVLDGRIVDFLNLTTKEKEQFYRGKQESASFLFSFLGGLSTIGAYTLITAQHLSAGASANLTTPENEFNTVLTLKKQVIASMRKEVATRRLRIGLIEDSKQQAEQLAYARADELTIKQLDEPNQDFAAPQSEPASEKNRDLHLGQESDAQKAPASLITLEPVSAAKSTLLSQISELKLSIQVDDFLKKSLLPFLTENLSDVVLNALDLANAKLPYKDTYLDAGQVNLYKNLMNAFYHLQKGLVELEKQGKHEYSDDFLSRAFFITSTGMSVGLSIYKAIIAINTLTGNSQLTALLEQGLNIVGPIKQIPGLSSFFEDKKVVSKKPVSVLDSEKESSMLKQMVEGLYQLQATIDARTTTKKAKALSAEEFDLFSDENHPHWKTLAQSLQDEVERSSEIEGIVNSLSNIGIELTNISAVLKSIQKLQAALNNTAAGSHELILANLQELRSEFGASIIMQVDEAEFTLAFKTGALSSQLSKRFDKFYEVLLESIVQTSEQKDLELLIDTSPTEKRIENEKQRLAILEKTNSGGALQAQIFDSSHSSLKEIENIYESIEEIDLSYPEDTERLVEQYEKLMPYIRREIATIESVGGIYTTSDFRAILQKIQFRIIKYASELTQQDSKNSVALSYLYAEIDKILKAISGKEKLDINDKLMLINLINTQDKSLSKVFDEGLSELLNLKKITPQSSVKELLSFRSVLVDNKELVLRNRMSVFNRITNILRQHTQDKTLFDHPFVKDALLDCYKELVPLLVSITGDQASDYQLYLEILKETGTKEEFEEALFDLLAYRPQLEKLIVAMVKTDLVNSNLTQMRISHFEEQLSNEKNQAHNKIEQFKQVKFEQILDTTIRSLVDQSMGPYTDTFFKHIRLFFIKTQEKILRDITIEDNIDDKVTARLTFQFNRLMEIILNKEGKLGYEMTIMRQSYLAFCSANDNYHEIGVIKDEFEKQDPMKKNQLIQSILSEIKAFENEVKQFVQLYETSDEMTPHVENTTAFINRLKIYQIITQDPQLQQQYNNLQIEKKALTQELRQENPIAQQKFELIENYEQQIIEYAKHHDIAEVLAEIKSLHRKFKLFDELIAVYTLNAQLLIHLNQNRKQKIPSVYVHSKYYQKLCELKDNVIKPSYYDENEEEFKKDKAAFKRYYSIIQPLLAEQDPTFTPERYDGVYTIESDKLDPLREALETLAPTLEPRILVKADVRLQQIQLATTIKQILQDPKMEPEQRKRVVKQLVEDEIKIVISTLPDRITEFFKTIFKMIQRIFAGKSITAITTQSEFKDHFDSVIKPDDLMAEDEKRDLELQHPDHERTGPVRTRS